MEDSMLVKGVIVDKDFSHPQMPKVRKPFMVVFTYPGNFVQEVMVAYQKIIFHLFASRFLKTLSWLS